MFDLTPFKKNQVARTDDAIDFYNMVENFFNDSRAPFKSFNEKFKLDIKEKDKEYTVEAEIPGYSKDDIHIKFDNDRLTISVSKKEEKSEEGEKYIHRERSYQSMERSIYLPNIDEGSIKASFENGILKITAPKSAEAAKKTEIKID